MGGLRGSSSEAGGPDSRRRLVYVPWSGLGDLVMALPLLASLRDHFTVLPITQRHHASLIRLLQDDGIIERDLPEVENLRMRVSPRSGLQVLRHIGRIAPEVTLIYGKEAFALAALCGGLRGGDIVFSTLKPGSEPCAPGGGWRFGRFHRLPSSGNQVEDQWRFADYLGHPRSGNRWRLSPAARARLRDSAPRRLAGADYVAVAPWSSDPRRDTAAVYFKGAIDMVVHDMGLPVVITGTSAHAAEVSSLVADVPADMVFDLVGKTELSELLGVIAGSRFLVANDSGNMHLAVLIGSPAVVFFPATTPEMLVSEEWHETMIPVRFPAWSSGSAARDSRADRRALLDAIIPAALRSACP